MKSASTICFLLICFFGNSQTQFYLDFGTVRSTSNNYGVTDGFQVGKAKYLSLAESSNTSSSYSQLLFCDSNGIDSTRTVEPPYSQSYGNHFNIFKLNNSDYAYSIKGDSFGLPFQYTKVIDSSGGDIWNEPFVSYQFQNFKDSNYLFLSIDSAQKGSVELHRKTKGLEWKKNISQLLGSHIIDTGHLSIWHLDQSNQEIFTLIKGQNNDSSLSVKLDESGKVLSRDYFITKDFAMIAKTSVGWVLAQDTNPYPNLKSLEILLYDDSFHLRKRILSEYNHLELIRDIEVENGRIYLLIHHHTDGKKYGSKILTEIRQLNLDGNLIKRNFYRYTHFPHGYFGFGQDVIYTSLDICSDKGFFVTGKISDNRDARTIALKLDSNGVGKISDTVKVPVQQMPLGFRDTILTTIPLTNSMREFSVELVNVFPNPANSQVTIQSNQEIQLIIMYNSIGERVELLEPIRKDITIAVTEFNEGVYILEILSISGFIERKRLIISR